jgi:hypothetical protein
MLLPNQHGGLKCRLTLLKGSYPIDSKYIPCTNHPFTYSKWLVLGTSTHLHLLVLEVKFPRNPGFCHAQVLGMDETYMVRSQT